MEMLKNIWINYGWSHPWLSSLIAAASGLVLWWAFGLFVTAATARSQAVTQAQQSPTPIVQQSAGPGSTQQQANVSGGSTNIQAGRDANVTINRAAPNETIPGTNATEQQIRDTFPFGYVIFSQRGGQWTYSPLPSDKMQFEGDWAHVSIIIDFPAKIVRWSLPEFRSTNTNLQFTNLRVDNYPVALDRKVHVLALILVRGQPMLCTATLSENQRFPVFVLGARILSEQEIQAREFDAPWSR